MKKLITLIIVAVLAFTTQAQDITNKLSATGSFKIIDNSDIEFFSLSHQGIGYLGDGSTGYAGSRTLNLLGNNGSGGLSISSYLGSGFNARSRIEFYTNDGSIGSLNTATDGDPIGWLNYFGYNGSSWSQGAEITVQVDGSVSGSNIPMSIEFVTNNGTTNAIKMTIKADGTVNIADLAGSYSGGQAYVVVNDAGDLSGQDAAPSKSLGNEIQQLKEENAALKAEMSELRKMIEVLMNEK